MPLTVARRSVPQQVAAIIAARCRETRPRTTVLRALGPDGARCALEAVAIARALVAAQGLDLACAPFLERGNGRDRPAVVLLTVAPHEAPPTKEQLSAIEPLLRGALAGPRENGQPRTGRTRPRRVIRVTAAATDPESPGGAS